MRMRKKKNLEQRIEECKNLFVATGEDRNFETANNKKEYLNLEKIFGNSNPVQLEIGCGKGRFCCEAARRNPNVNFLAVEKSANVIVEACENGREYKNLYFLQCSAEYLPKYLKDGTADRIYLNFSCPFPKNSYAVHRLTNSRFLEIYKKLLAPGAEIHQKTDNTKFFEYSINELSGFGFTLKNVTFDLHNSGFEGNIMTEYEEKFTNLGQPIYRLEAFLRQSAPEK